MKLIGRQHFVSVSVTSDHSGKVVVKTTRPQFFVVETPAVVADTEDSTNMCRCIALWDTGATFTVISKELQEALGLQLTGTRVCRSMERKLCQPTCQVVVALPNDGVYVSEASVADDPQYAITVGLDIISQLDFHLTHDPDGQPVCIISEI